MSSEGSYIFDPESPQEMTRLINQDRFITESMGGPLAGMPQLPPGAQVLDLACGPGGWVLDVAWERSDVEVCGVDSSRTMVTYANARARSQGLSNASFGVMDITLPLDFADASFDLLNARFLLGVLKREAWSPFLAECTRLLRPGGLLRLTEGNDAGESLSPALEQLTLLGTQALWRAGYGFSSTGRTFGMSAALLHLFKQAGYHDMHLTSYAMDYSAGTSTWADFFHNSKIMLLQIKPLLISHGLVTPEAFEGQYQQAIMEMHAPDFAAVGHLLSIWGQKNG